ncbi:MAG: hypothetical protein QM820_45485 [Minicystis sp.]
MPCVKMGIAGPDPSGGGGMRGKCVRFHVGAWTFTQAAVERW